jgi:flagellar basal-body rod protein FlgB
MPTMAVGDIPLLAMLKSRLGYLSDRQRVIAENVANANTPGYTARDLKPFSFEAQMQAATSPGASAPAGVMAVTQPGHMQAANARRGSAGAVVKAAKTPDSEETIDGNGVVLEDQMIKLTDTRMDYDAAIGFYQQSLSMLKMAVKKPGS